MHPSCNPFAYFFLSARVWKVFVCQTLSEVRAGIICTDIGDTYNTSEKPSFSNVLFPVDAHHTMSIANGSLNTEIQWKQTSRTKAPITERKTQRSSKQFRIFIGDGQAVLSKRNEEDCEEKKIHGLIDTQTDMHHRRQPHQNDQQHHRPEMTHTKHQHRRTPLNTNTCGVQLVP